MKHINDLLLDLNIKQQMKLDYCPIRLSKKNKVNIIALGDVGTTVLIGLRLLGNDVISDIGICDIDTKNIQRLEKEINQINYPFGLGKMPKVYMVDEDGLFDCDVLVFCASKRVPPLGEGGDVRMAQLEANREIVEYYGKLSMEKNFEGLVAIVSDPVDPLAKIFLKSSGLKPSQVQGYGLGVMNSRALYYAEKEKKYSSYIKEGRAFGPHGGDLVIANSIRNYDEQLSMDLTRLTVNANYCVRELGYKPYIAPALSSAAISLILTMRGEWHYGSVFIGSDESGAFFGIKNRFTTDGIEYEDIELDPMLYKRIKDAFINLVNLG